MEERTLMEHGHRHLCAHGHMYGHAASYSSAWDPGTLLAPLSTMLWVALFIVLVWALLKWISPYVMSEIADIFGMSWEEAPSALEILRQRYAAGEIDAVTFEQMRERLEASYHQEEQRRPS